MYRPDWRVLVPMVVSVTALVVSLMVYRLSLERDEEARELAFMGRAMEIYQQAERIIGRLDGVVEESVAMGKIKSKERAEKVIERMEQLKTDVIGLKWVGGITRADRTELEKLYVKVFQIAVESDGLERDTKACKARKDC